MSFWPKASPQQVNDYFTNPELLRSMIESFGGAPGMNIAAKGVGAGLKSGITRMLEENPPGKVAHPPMQYEGMYAGNIGKTVPEDLYRLGETGRNKLYDPFLKRTISRPDIEDMLGLTRENLKRMMREGEHPDDIHLVKQTIDHYVNLLGNNKPSPFKWFPFKKDRTFNEDMGK